MISTIDAAENHRKLTALFLAVAMAVVVGSALAFQYIGGYIPCKLCYEQRIPYYVGIPVMALAVLASAVTVGLWPAIFASIVSALAYNFFFLDPLYTLDISDPESAVALGFFFCVAVIASNLTARVQRQAFAARSRARTTEDLYLFSKKLAGTATLDDVLWATAFQIASMLKLRVVLLLPENGTIAVKAGGI